MRYRSFVLLILLFFVSCTATHDVHETVAAIPSQKLPTVVQSKIQFDCNQNDQCLKWREWVDEIEKKSSRYSVDPGFSRARAKFAPDENIKKFSNILNRLGTITISYSEHHCLDNQTSCIFPGENKIFFNLRSQNLSKGVWQGIFWHEVFHLLFPQVEHIACTQCKKVDKKRQLMNDCDKHSFSSYGLERAWHLALARNKKSDKKERATERAILAELKSRICE